MAEDRDGVHLIRVLLIEDNPAEARLLRECLAENPGVRFEVEWADRLTRGLSLLQDKAVDVAVLDLNLPDSVGLDTLVRLREPAPALPVVVLTGLQDEEVARRALQKGAQDYIVKGSVDDRVLGRALMYAVERKRYEEALRTSERSLATLMSNLPGMAYQCANKPDWPMSFVSEGCAELTEFSPGDFMGGGVGYNVLIVPEDKERVWAEVQEACSRGCAFEMTYRIRTAHGQEKTVWEKGRAVAWEGGVPSVLEGIIIDISARVNAERELEAAQAALRRAETLEAIGMIAGGVAHEVRNPLFAINTVSMALGKKLAGQEGVSEYLGHIQEQVRRLAALMDDLLTLGRPARPEEFVPCVVQQVLTDSLHQLELKTPGTAAACALDLSGEPMAVHGAPGKLSQVFVNIIQNAISFSPPGRPVRVEACPDGEWVRVLVTDEGPGISEDLLPKLFSPFASHRQGGTGLGLAIVKQIVAAHGGTVHAGNNASGPGATFTVSLPRKAENPGGDQ